ncbi:sensor histidine kinase [Cohnella luojiensis]|uniref:histidine kinase n=1 Tax=Cohnella luojiensis TaxID=652876 RepID=A0A4Y8M424_9BACL|nr:HAMP domain-containing sensor histidine kinase [Cohnella luojiensis]TFE28936.1 HAMP domain-containing histidine kinase [Cohnella luojiensis]
MRHFPVKLRTYLLLVNAISIAVILGLLFFCYSRMLLDASTFLWLGGATLVAGLLSFVLHFAMIRPLEQSVIRIGDASGEIASGTLGAEVPIVGPKEFRQLAERFNTMSRQLKGSFERIRQAEASRRELVANVAHDLRTPLALLQSHAEALQDGVVQDEENFANYLRTIRMESIRLGALVQDLFELSRIDAGEEPFVPHRVSLEDVLVQTLKVYAPSLDNKRLQVEVSLPEPSPVVMAAETSLRRILGNLLENAIRHSPEGRSLALSAEIHSDSEWIIRLRDEGEGVAQQDREKIFRRFYRTDLSRKRDGSGLGLGLAIARSLVERQGGKIGVEPAAQGGSVFWFTVPRAETNHSKEESV